MGLSRVAQGFGSSALAIRRFSINEAGPVYVEIEGRRAGIMSWIFTLLRFDTSTTLRLYATHLELVSSSLAGRFREMMPLSRVCNLGTSYLKPFAYLLAAVGTGIQAITVACTGGNSVFLVSLAAATAVFIWLYFYRKAIVLFFVPVSNSDLHIAFRRSIIEGKNIDAVAAKRIIAIVQQLVRAENAKATLPSSMPPLEPQPSAAPPSLAVESPSLATEPPSFAVEPPSLAAEPHERPRMPVPPEPSGAEHFSDGKQVMIFAIAAAALIVAAIWFFMTSGPSRRRPSEAQPSVQVPVQPSIQAPTQPSAQAPALSSTPSASYARQTTAPATQPPYATQPSAYSAAPSQPSAYSAAPSQPERQTAVPVVAAPAPVRQQNWVRPKEWFSGQCDIIGRNVVHYTSGGYRYSADSARRIGFLVRTLRERIAQNSADGALETFNTLKREYESFMSSCQWQANLRHPRYRHVISGPTQQQWLAEDGWEFVNPGTSDLTVRRKHVAVQCNACRGSGQIVSRARCGVCSGRGRVPNPAAQAGQVAGAVGGVLGALGGRRRGRVAPVLPHVSATMPCSTCNGSGFVRQQSQCRRCSGSGRVVR